MVERFKGFNSGAFDALTLPQEFFSLYFPLVDNIAELKILLFCFWALPQKETRFKYLRHVEFSHSVMLMDALAVIDPQRHANDILAEGLTRTLEHGALLKVEISIEGKAETLYLVNSPAGQQAITQLQTGHWRPGDFDNPIEILPPRPNIFTLYEANIGPLTPIITDHLKELRQTYSEDWLQEAIEITVKQGKRSLRYVEAILNRWQQEGKSDEVTGRSTQSDVKTNFLSGKYGKYLNH